MSLQVAVSNDQYGVMHLPMFNGTHKLHFKQMTAVLSMYCSSSMTIHPTRLMEARSPWPAGRGLGTESTYVRTEAKPRRDVDFYICT